MRYCVMVARQTLTLFVWVQILVPQPKETSALPRFLHIEVWLSLVERYVRDVEAGGSNPLTSTKMKPGAIDAPGFLFLKKMSANLWISFFIFDCWSINCSKALRFSSGIVFCCMMRIEKQTGP